MPSDGQVLTWETALSPPIKWATVSSTEAVPGDTVVTETAFGQSATAGTSGDFSRANHTHGTPANPVPAHAALTSSVHGFDASGNAPPQAHGTAAHTGTIGAWSQIDKTTSSLGDITTRSAGDLSSGTLDGDRLPALSATKKGGAPATGTPSGKFLKDDGTWATPAGGTSDHAALSNLGFNASGHTRFERGLWNINNVATFGYTDGVLTSIQTVDSGETVTTTFGYTDGQISTITAVYPTKTKTSTFTYAAGVLDHIDVVWT